MLIAPRGLGPAGETHMPKRTKRSAPRKRSAPKRAAPRKRAPKFSRVPEGMRTVTPYLAIDGAARALDFYKHAFGAKEIAREPAPVNPVVDAIRQGAEKTGTGFDYLLATAQRESALDPKARARSSSASGLFQFIEQTWLGLVRTEGPKLGLGDED